MKKISAGASVMALVLISGLPAYCAGPGSGFDPADSQILSPDSPIAPNYKDWSDLTVKELEALLEGLPLKSGDIVRRRDELVTKSSKVAEDEDDLEKLLALAETQGQIVVLEKELFALDKQKYEIERELFARKPKPEPLAVAEKGKAKQATFELEIFGSLKPISNYQWQKRRLKFTQEALEKRSKALDYKQQEVDANKGFLKIKIEDLKSGQKRSEMRQALLKQLFAAKSDFAETSRRLTLLNAEAFACQRNNIRQIESLERRRAVCKRLLAGKSQTRQLEMTRFLFNERPLDLSGKEFCAGIVLDDSLDKIVRIHSLLPDSPSVASGLKAGDEILLVDKLPVPGLACKDVEKMLKGQKDTRVDVVVLSSDAVKKASLEMTFRPLEKTHPQLKEELAEFTAAGNTAGRVQTLLAMAEYAVRYSSDTDVVEEYFKQASELARKLAKSNPKKSGGAFVRAYTAAAGFYLKQYSSLFRLVISPDLPEGITPQLPPVTAEEWLARAMSCKKELLNALDSSEDSGRLIALLADDFYQQFSFRRIKSSEAAVDLYKKAIAIEKQLGGDHLLSAARFESKLAGIYVQQGQWSLACQMLSDCMANYKNLLPNEATELAIVRIRLAEAMVATANYKEALILLDEELELVDRIYTQKSGIDEEIIADAYKKVLYPLVKVDEKLGRYQQCLDVGKQLIPLLDRDGQRQGSVLILAGKAAAQLGLDQESVSYFSEALLVLKGAAKSICLNELALVYIDNDKSGEAKVLCLAQVDNYTSKLANDPLKYSDFIEPAARTADILSGLKEYETANKLYQLAVSGYRESLVVAIEKDKQAGEMSERAKKIVDSMDDALTAFSASLEKSGRQGWAEKVAAKAREFAEKSAGLDTLDLDWLKQFSTSDQSTVL